MKKWAIRLIFFLSLPIRGRLGDGSPEPKIILQILAKSQDQNALFCVKIFSSRNVTFFTLALIFKIFLCFCLFFIALYHRNGIIKTVKGGGFKKNLLKKVKKNAWHPLKTMIYYICKRKEVLNYEEKNSERIIYRNHDYLWLIRRT